MSPRHWLIGAALLLSAIVTGLLFTFMERYTEQRDNGWGVEARRNPYLAAEQFLQVSGVRTRNVGNVAELASLNDNDTLLLDGSTHIYNRQRADQLLNWVEGGGHLVLVAKPEERDWLLERMEVSLEPGRELFDFHNPLRQFLGDDAEAFAGKSASEILREHNRRNRSSGGDTEPGEPAEEAPRDPPADPADLVTLADAQGRDYHLYFDPVYLLEHPGLEDLQSEPTSWARIRRDDTGVPFMQFERGRGLVTLVADGGIWHSGRIGHFDHAYFLTQLSSGGEFIFVTRPRFDSLLVLAGRYAGEFFFAGALALMAWLLWRSRRLGPVVAVQQQARRSLTEHLEASGHYYWRADRGCQLAQRIRARLLRRLGGEQCDQYVKRRIISRLHQLTHLTESNITAALWGVAPQGEEAFTRQMRTLQQIEAAL
ncbi:DUF4350 domain-containing protein [Microbulbifer discodermiae]|uniref:DUF4350 domain-containing protein n=1 Tax=Microbulbifer sp. 2201CG32-9 TaxID=3232309 RepID=UPI00345BBDE8